MASDVLVSARIAPTKKQEAKDILASLGATTTDLINCAFDYVVNNHKLPETQECEVPSMDDFKEFLNDSTLCIDWGNMAPDGNYKELLREWKQADYDSLA